ncbi:MAG: recombinase family protein [Lachnospiraceae bacterium]|nr:recombinase family protein [Lachnospiraceae bacterium]
MNALYSRDISHKVTSAMNIRAAEGQYMAAFTPYGYIKAPSDKHHLIIDEVAAAVVREIFQWAADGVKKGDIAKRLNDRGEPTVIEHMNMVGVNKRSFRPKEKKLWSITTIRDTLKNEVYIGTTVWNKTRRVTTGSTRCVKNPKSEWQRIENTHEAIISKELFEKANEMAFTGKKGRTIPAPVAPLFYCGSCGRAMSLNGSNKGYRCRVAAVSGAPECQLVKRNRIELEQMTMEQAQARAKEELAQLEKNKAIWRHNTREWKGTDALRDKEEKLSSKKLKAYEQYKAGKLDHTTYITKRDEISSKLEAVRLDLAEIERKAKEGEYNLTASIEIEKKLREVIALEAFDKKIILYVIEKIIIKDDGTEEIFWRDLSLHE